MLLMPEPLFRELVVVCAQKGWQITRALQATGNHRYHQARQMRPAWAFAPEMPQFLHGPDTRLPVTLCWQRRDYSRRNASYT
jgi:hypothetical protein